MAKQAGIHGLRGKVNGMSYYYSKNGGELTRKINEGIGERVKSSAAYVNTRKNNAEFGAAGAVAGAIMRTIPQKYRYILKSTATGLLNKEIKKGMELDTQSPWGERILSNRSVLKVIETVSYLSKIAIPTELSNAIVNNIKQDSANNNVFVVNNVYASSLFIEELKAKGATHFSLLYYGMEVDMPVFSQPAQTYIQPSGKIELLSAISRFNESLSNSPFFMEIESETCNISLVPDETSFAGGIFAVLLPERLVGGEYNVLQEQCAAVWLPLSFGTQPEP